MQRKQHKSNRWRRPLVLAGFGVVIAGSLVVGAAVHTVNGWIQTAPQLTKASLEGGNSSKMLDQEGNVIWESALEKRIQAHYDDLPKTYIQALTATENANFFKDNGYSLKALAAAGKQYLLHDGSTKRGGSTITQQLIKLSVFSTDAKDQTIKRKVQELWLANALTSAYSKEEILEFYVNKMYMGHGRYGVQTISQYYYGKELKQLSLSQQAIIAGIGQMPDTYDLYTPASRLALTQRRREVLLSMWHKKYITKAEFEKANKEPIDAGVISLEDQIKNSNDLNDTVFANQAYIQSALKEVRKRGYDPIKDGLVIRTGLAPKQQAVIQKEIDQNPALAHLPNVQMAATAVDPKTGQVRAQVGARNQDRSIMFGFNRATQAGRSTGSGIKPLLDYGPAIEYLNWSSNQTIQDTPYTYPGTSITVGNADGTYLGNIPMHRALALSHNPTAIRAFDSVGATKAGVFLNRLGLAPKETYTSSDALGVDGSTEQMAGAYATIANGGTYHGAYYVTEIETPDGEKHVTQPISRTAMSAGTAYILTDMMKGVLAPRATGDQAKVPKLNQAVKTGTVGYDAGERVPARAIKDSWVNGYTKGLALSMWMGYDQPLAPGSQINVADAQQDQKVYASIMKQLGFAYDHSDWEKPRDVSKDARGGLQRTGVDVGTVAGLPAEPRYADTETIFDKFKQPVQKPQFVHEKQVLPVEK